MNDTARPGFGRTSRLRNRSEIAAVRNGGRSNAGRYCVVNILQTPPDNLRRAAFSISKRYSKLAVERNRARRLFREVFSRIYGELPPCWVIFVPRRQMKDAVMWDVLDDVRKCVSLILSGQA
ncbi:MAG: ribonuclease P protein component [Victivallales bacterium]|nr:ribonuclease P protein component [Victivallales bacterium]